jgi:hypothetical protein
LGVDYTIPLGLVASIAPGHPELDGAQSARIILHSGEELRLEPAGDLGESNGGMLIFSAGLEHPEYVPWREIERVQLDGVEAAHPTGGSIAGAPPKS